MWRNNVECDEFGQFFNGVNFLFICGSAEVGRDGVGDYTRGLASELSSGGHVCRIIALSDSYASVLAGDGEDGVVLRLNPSLSWEERIRSACEWMGSFRVDWVSIQYVPYAFHPKGICMNLPKYLLPLTSGSKVHMMFHETWVGFSRIAPWRHRFYGIWQRRLACRLVEVLQPAAVHTSNRLYQLQLTDCGMEVEILPIFSNIPVAAGGTGWIGRELASLGILPEERGSWMVLGVFGSIHQDFCPIKALDSCVVEAEKVGRRVAFLVIGRAGGRLVAMEEEVKLHFGNKVIYHYFGEQPAGKVSEFLAAMDKGVATMPRELMDKSGTIAAFRAHGIPLIEGEWQDFPEYTSRMEKESQREGEKDSASYSVRYVARKFLEVMN